MKKIALSLVIFLLIFGGLAISAEEVKVPFGAIKSSCYGEIDMSKAEFALSEVGEECVNEDWLEEHKPEPKESELPSDFPIKKLIEKEPSLVDVVKVVDNPKELLEFMNGYFTIGYLEDRNTGETTAYSPEKFLEARWGACNDWATFAGYILHENGYYAKKFAYSKHPMDDGHAVAIWKGKEGQYSYLTVLGERAKIYWKVGSSIEGVLASEAERYNLDKDILAYALLEPTTLTVRPETGPKIAKASLEKLSNIAKLDDNEWNLEPKEKSDSIKHNYFTGRIVEIEQVNRREYLITCAVQLDKIFKNPSSDFVLVEFKTNPDTDYLDYHPSTDRTEEIEFDQVEVGDKGIIYVESKVTRLGEISQFTCRHIIV